MELRIIFFVALAVLIELGRPEFHSRLRNHEIAATFVGMPEAAIDENHGLVLPHDDVRRTWQILLVQTIAIASGEEEFPHDELRLRVLATNPRHAMMPLLCCHPICHTFAFLQRYENRTKVSAFQIPLRKAAG